MFLNIVIIAFLIAQFTPAGRAFLSTGLGAAATVGLAAVSIVFMLPGLLAGHVANLLFIGLWGWVAYPRLPLATSYIKGQARKLLR